MRAGALYWNGGGPVTSLRMPQRLPSNTQIALSFNSETDHNTRKLIRNYYDYYVQETHRNPEQALVAPVPSSTDAVSAGCTYACARIPAAPCQAEACAKAKKLFHGHCEGPSGTHGQNACAGDGDR